MAQGVVVSFASYFLPWRKSCSELRAERMKGKWLGWASYVAAALARHGTGRYQATVTILPSHCRGEYSVVHPEFEAPLRISEFPVRRLLRGVYDYRDYGEIAEYITGLAGDPLILHAHNLFSINFAIELLRFFNKVKKARRVYVVAQQHSKPPYKYYPEAVQGLLGRAVRLLGEPLFRLRRRLIDAYIVMNRRSYEYLRSIGVDEDQILYQHVGVDYETVSPAHHPGDEEFWQGCDHRLVEVSLVTREYGGYSKGVDLLPAIKEVLEKKGYRACIALIGDIHDRELAQKLWEAGIKLTGFLPRRKLFRIVARADLYILPARKEIYYGGVGTSVIEALALDTPVVSPTLEHVPNQAVVDKLGVKTEWVTRSNIDRFADAIITGLEDKKKFQPRQTSRKFYDIRVMTQNIEKLYDKLLST